MHGWIKKSKPEETTILRSRSAIFVSRWGRHEGSTNCSVCVFVTLLNTTFCLHVVYQPRRPFSCSRKQSSARLTTWLTHGSTHIIFTSLPDYFEDGGVPCLWRFLALNIAGKDRNCTTTVNALQSNLDYPDLDYPEFSIIQTFSLVPILSWIFIRFDQDP